MVQKALSAAAAPSPRHREAAIGLRAKAFLDEGIADPRTGIYVMTTAWLERAGA